MNNTRKYVVYGATAIALCLCGAWIVSGKKHALQEHRKANESERQNMSLVDPCAVIKGDANSPELIRLRDERMTREIHGYPKDTPISEAIRIFNNESKCDPLGKEMPPLTEEELLSAMVDSGDFAMVEGEKSKRVKVWEHQKNATQQIVLDRKMPKGTLLAYEKGGWRDFTAAGKGEIASVAWKIYLYLDLDKNPRESNYLNLEQIRLIRKVCIKTKPLNTSP